MSLVPILVLLVIPIILFVVGLYFIFSKQVKKLWPKLLWLLACIGVVGDMFYEATFVDASDKPGFHNTDIFGAWWPVVPIVLWITIIVLEVVMYRMVQKSALGEIATNEDLSRIQAR